MEYFCLKDKLYEENRIRITKKRMLDPIFFEKGKKEGYIGHPGVLNNSLIGLTSGSTLSNLS